VEKFVVDLDPTMIASGEWKSQSFKKYNFEAFGAPPSAGHLHPLLKVREEFRHIFLEMGSWILFLFPSFFSFLSAHSLPPHFSAFKILRDAHQQLRGELFLEL